ncbi:MAG TPA: hypothetical protein VMW35_00225 [Myxococcota bacterium]|nr:hypothetical protein [Myxococcota bacterium]
MKPGPLDPAELARFLETFLYREPAFLVDEIVAVDRAGHAIEALLDTTRPLPFASQQRVDANHPAHVAAGEMLMVTGGLGCLSAWLFHGVRWDQGWSGFGNRVHRADFKSLARIGPPLRLHARETQWRDGPKRVVIRYEFRFEQEGRVVYVGDQSAMFFRDLALDET